MNAIHDPGRYDAECTQARESAGAIGAVLIIFGGRDGHGFSVQLPPSVVANLPQMLRNIANDVEQQWQTRLAREITNGPKG